MKRPHYIALGTVVVLTLIILNLPSRTTARLKLGIGSLFVPAFWGANAAQQAVSKTGDAVLPRSELLRQNETLRRQNQEMRLQLAQAEQTKGENERLRQLLGWQRQQPHKYKLANVVLRDPANWWRTVQIDLGSRDGVRTNLPVMTMNGLVGRITSVHLTSSQVVLLGDPNCRVAARVDNEAHDTGVIGPAGTLDTEFVELGFLSRNANLKPGQAVRTSGTGGIFPKDIFIGHVVESHPVEYGLSTVAQVKLGANLGSLEEVWVMMDP